MGKEYNKYFETLRKVLIYKETFIAFLAALIVLIHPNLSLISSSQVKLQVNDKPSFAAKATCGTFPTGKEKVTLTLQLSNDCIQNDSFSLCLFRMTLEHHYLSILKCCVWVTLIFIWLLQSLQPCSRIQCYAWGISIDFLFLFKLWWLLCYSASHNCIKCMTFVLVRSLARSSPCLIFMIFYLWKAAHHGTIAQQSRHSYLIVKE